MIYFGLFVIYRIIEWLEYHKKDCYHRQHNKITELSKYLVRSSKHAKITYNNKWSAVEKFHGKTKIDHCPLCLPEKLHLMKYFDDIPLSNKRSELVN